MFVLYLFWIYYNYLTSYKKLFYTEYVKENNTVTVGTMTFKDVKEIEEFRESSLKEYKEGHDNALSERRKQYEEEIAEINRAYEEEKIKFLKKINNIADVMAM